MAWRRGISLLLLTTTAALAAAQEVPAPPATGVPVLLTLKHAVELSLSNSKDIQLAKLQVQAAQDTAQLTHSDFLPNLYAGSGAGYTYGLPETPGGRPPALFSITYTQDIFNGPVSGLAKQQQEQVKAQRAILDDTKNLVMVRVASSYLELVKVRHALELLRAEKDSADKIVDVTKEREGEGFELPVEVTKAMLTQAQVRERILQLEGRQDELEVYLRNQLGLANDQAIEVTPEDLPGAAEEEGANLIAMATQSNTSLLAAESDVKGKEFRLKGEKRGYWPSLELVAVYDVLAKHNFNNNDYYVVNDKNFRYNNLNAGVSVNVPLFSAKTRANVALAEINLAAAKINLSSTRTQVSADVRQKSRKVQQADAAKDVARLQLQLAQQNVAVLQSQFGEGKTNLRDVEKARLDENEKWMAYLDANFRRQQAQLDLLKTAGQLEKVLQ
ncbi:MAG TPA: TolC family protein [Terriglobales bacterium]|nr:TolC family protein [Terriglobales bacterium]